MPPLSRVMAVYYLQIQVAGFSETLVPITKLFGITSQKAIFIMSMCLVDGYRCSKKHGIPISWRR